MSGRKHSEETKQIMYEAKQGKNNSNCGKLLTACEAGETKKKYLILLRKVKILVILRQERIILIMVNQEPKEQEGHLNQ